MKPDALLALGEQWRVLQDARSEQRAPSPLAMGLWCLATTSRLWGTSDRQPARRPSAAVATADTVDRRALSARTLDQPLRRSRVGCGILPRGRLARSKYRCTCESSSYVSPIENGLTGLFAEAFAMNLDVGLTGLNLRVLARLL
jgi:hypothetical protein